MIPKIAIRQLSRNTWRSVLTGGGVAVAVALLVVTNAFIGGFVEQMIRGATAIDVGQVRVVSDAYDRDPGPGKTFELSSETLSTVESLEEVRGIAPRVDFFGLLRTRGRGETARILGVDPERERRASPLDEAIVEGDWLGGGEASPTPGLMLGSGLADRIGAGVGDEVELVVDRSEGRPRRRTFRVVGVVESGSTVIDRQTAVIALDEAQSIAGLGQGIHELTIRTESVREAERHAGAVREVLGSRVAGAGEGAEAGDGERALVVKPWQRVVPELHRMIRMSSSSSWIFYLVVYFIAALGILNTQRMSALERRREFGVMQAVGMTPSRLFGLVVWESVFLGLLGALVGAGLGAGVSAYFAVHGFDISIFAESGSFSYMGVSFSERIPFVVDWRGVLEPVALVVPVAVACGLWPAVTSARLNPAAAVAGRD